MKYKVRVEFGFIDEIEVEAGSSIDAQNIVEDIVCAQSYTKAPEGSEFRLLQIEDENGNITDLF